jgi:signal transduction histidine kinase/CheY-like chemotaxis protein
MDRAPWPRIGAFARPLARLGAVFALGLAALVPAPRALAADDEAELLGVDRAEFELAGAAPRAVELPHTWALDGLAASGKGSYRIEFELPRAPERPWALAAARLGSRHAVRLNGALLEETSGAAAERRGVPAPALIDLPPALLRAGANRLEIDVDFDYRAGMSALAVGPTDLARARYVQAQVWNVMVPQAMNIVATGLALFMLSIWLRRRHERELGLFGALMIAISLRNVLATGSGNQWHTPGADFALYLLQVASAVLLAHFAMAFARREAPWLRRAVDVAAVVLVVAGALAEWQDLLVPLRAVAYPVVLALVVPSLWLLGVGAVRAHGARQATLAAGILLLAGAATHDYFYLRGLLPVMDRYWMPFTSPLALLAFAWALLDRFVGALASVETQAVELERKVAERTRELELANAAKTRFLAAASHDLRQPVVSISLLSGLLREQPVPPAMNPVLDRIGDSVQALNSLLKGLLDLSRFDAGVVEARVARVPLRPLVDTIVGDEREAARHKGIALRVRVPALEVHSDPVLLEQILRNLVGNAVRYTERGGVLVSARRRGADAVLVQVWDTGLGIAREDQALVFEEFVQLDNEARERSRGLGLGLSLVRRATTLLGAPLRLRSTPGRGSCFAVEFPFAGMAPLAAGGASASGADLQGLNVWVVDDDPAVREALRLRLAGWGADVSAFAGARAVDAALAGNGVAPRLLVTDQRLPDGNGVEVARRVHERFGRVPVLVVTGDTAPADVARLRASGLPVMHKPFGADELLVAVAALVPRGGLRGEGRAAPPRPPPASAS